jgi:hypothetical protein
MKKRSLLRGSIALLIVSLNKARASDLTNKSAPKSEKEYTDDTYQLLNIIKSARLNNTTVILEPRTYYTTETLDFQGIELFASGCTFIGKKNKPTLLLGGYANRRTNPNQIVGEVQNELKEFEDAIVEVRGAKTCNITIKKCIKIRLYATKDSAKDASIGYSNFFLADVDELILESPMQKDHSGWINENKFYINRIKKLSVRGGYRHNNNHFFGGNFEGDSNIVIDSGKSIYLHHIRAEGYLYVKFGANAMDCVVSISWTSSGHRYDRNDKIEVENHGRSCAVVHAMASTFSLQKIIGFNYYNYNVKQTHSIGSLTEKYRIKEKHIIFPENTVIFKSQDLFISQYSNYFTIYIDNRISGAVLMRVRGLYDKDIADAYKSQSYYIDGKGECKFDQFIALNYDRTNFWFDETHLSDISIELKSGKLRDLSVSGLVLARRVANSINQTDIFKSLQD